MPALLTRTSGRPIFQGRRDQCVGGAVDRQVSSHADRIIAEFLGPLMDPDPMWP